MTSRRVRMGPSQADRLLRDIAGVPDRPVGPHLSDQQFVEYAMGELSAEEFSRFDTHIASCPECASDIERMLDVAEGWQGHGGQAETATVHERMAPELSEAEKPGGPPMRSVSETFADLLQDQDVEIRIATLDALETVGAPGATPEVLGHVANLLRDANRDVRKGAAVALASIGPSAATPRVLAALGDLLDDADKTVRDAARMALARVTPADRRGLVRRIGAFFGSLITPNLALGATAKALTKPETWESEDKLFAVAWLEEANGDVTVTIDARTPDLDGIEVYAEAADRRWQGQFRPTGEDYVLVEFKITRAERAALTGSPTLRLSTPGEES